MEKKLLDRPWLQYLCAFLLPLLLLSAAFAALGITPFGDGTMLYSDAQGQYVQNFSYLHRLLNGQESLLYSFSKDLGGVMLGQMTWYVMNPVFCIFALGTLEDLPLLYSLACMLNTALCGVTMLAFLRHTVSAKKEQLIFSTIYALSGYCVANNFQLFWLMSVALLPLVAWGVRRVVDGKSAALYFVSLAYAILQNFYIGYMLCVFSLLYFTVLFFVTRRERAEATPPVGGGSLWLRFGVASLLAGLLCAVLLVPICLSFVEGRLTQVGYSDFQFVENMPLLQIGAKLFTGANSTSELINGLPNIFCTLFPVALCLLFFMDDRSPSPKRVGYFVLLLVYLLSFYVRTFSAVFQMFSHTNWFNYRYSFVFTFLLLQVAAEELEHILDIPTETVKKCLVVMAVATVLIFAQRYEFVSGAMALVDWLLLLAIFGGLAFHKRSPERASYQSLVLLMLLCTSFSLYLNYYSCVKKLDAWACSYEDFSKPILATGAIVDGLRAADDSFYRMESEATAPNNAIFYGYNGVGQFTSTERAYILQGLSRFGVGWYDMRSFYTPGVPASMDSFLGLKYIMSENDLAQEKGYEKRLTIEETSLYQNPAALPVAILSDSSLKELEPKAVNIFQLQNELWQGMSSVSETIFTPVTDITYSMHALTDAKSYTTDGDKLDIVWDTSSETDTSSQSSAASSSTAAVEAADPDYYMSYSFTAESDDPIYIYLGGVLGANGFSDQALKYVGTYEPGETVTGTVPLVTNVSKAVFETTCDAFSVYYEDLDALAAHSGVMSEREVTVQKERGSVLSGTFTADRAQTLLFTIPYDEGWTLYIDGAPAEYEKTLDIFMACPVSPGTHTWRMVYIPEGMSLGAAISAAAALALIAAAILEKRSLRRFKSASDDVDAIVSPVGDDATRS